MKASELRIGNYIERKVSKNIWDEFTVRPIDIYRLYECTSWLIEHRPIQLTEELLLKFGFEVECETYNLNGFSIEDIHNGEKWCIYMFDEYNSVDCSLALIQYAHQLQNLYFALTGEELTLKQN